MYDFPTAKRLKRRKNKMFRFTPTPVSSASIFWWCGEGGFADRQCTMDVDLPRWWDERFPPLSLYYGGRDYLVLADPLLERLATKEKHIKLIRAEKIPLAEHCDFYWAADAVEWCFHSILGEPSFQKTARTSE
jgi:lysosomal acid lipase/cholesteryl ester hydrolase